MISGLVAMILAVTTIPAFPQSRELAAILGIVFAITMPITVILGIKMRKLKLDGMEKAMLHAYRASLSLEEYLKPGINDSKFENLETAKDEIQNLKFSVIYGWKYFSINNYVITSLENNIREFVDNIKKLESAIEIDKIEKVDIVIILQELIKFFDAQKKDSFNEINIKFSTIRDIPPKIRMEEKMKRKIIESMHKKSTKQHIIINGLLIVSGISSIMILRSYNIQAEAQIVAFVGITISPLIVYWLKMLKIEI